MSAGISSVLPSATYAGALTEFWSPAGAGGGGGGSPGVTQIVAGNNITISPGDGEGVVTINATGGGGGGVTEILAVGDGIAVSAPTGIVNISNTGVTSLVAGPGISVSAAAGAVTVSNTAGSFGFLATPTADIPKNTQYDLPYQFTAPGLYFFNMYGLSPVSAYNCSINMAFAVSVTAPNGIGGGGSGQYAIVSILQNNSMPDNSGGSIRTVPVTRALGGEPNLFPFQLALNFGQIAADAPVAWAAGQNIMCYVSKLAYPVPF